MKKMGVKEAVAQWSQSMDLTCQIAKLQCPLVVVTKMPNRRKNSNSECFLRKLFALGGENFSSSSQKHIGNPVD